MSPHLRVDRRRGLARGAAHCLALAFSAFLTGPVAASTTLRCGTDSVLTLLATDTRAVRALFAISGGTGDGHLVVIDADGETARVYRDELTGRRRGAAYGPGPFLLAARCGENCLQPVQFRDGSWSPLGSPLDQADDATLHFTYSADGAPWMIRQRLAERPGVSWVEASRWDGREWRPRGGLQVQALGAPAASPDPRSPDAVLVGTGRFSAQGEPVYWLPTIPEVEGATGGQVVALATGAAYLAFDSSLFFSSDGGNTWFPERWTPWSPRPGSTPLWTPGVDFWLDLPVAPRHDGLPVLWYDERREAAPSVYLARWKERSGWDRARQIPLTTATGLSVEEALVTERGKWLLFGPCRGRALDALVVEADGAMRRPAIPLELVEGR